VSAPGLSALYEALAHTVTRHGLDAFGVAIDDVDLGRQAFATGPDAGAVLTDLAADADRRWAAQPALTDPPAELDVLLALAATALRLAVADPGADTGAALEVAVRALPEVTAVTRTGAVVEATVAAGRRDRVVARLAAVDPAARGALVLHETPAPGDAPTPGALRRRAELIAVRSLPETGEMEVHLRAGSLRTIGRAALARAGAGAVAATLDALAELDPDAAPSAPWRVGWVRTIDTTADREFLVAVMVRRGYDQSLYGLASGASPIEAAARAALHASNRVVTREPPGPGPHT
jgi:hypothetical protein